MAVLSVDTLSWLAAFLLLECYSKEDVEDRSICLPDYIPGTTLSKNIVVLSD